MSALDLIFVLAIALSLTFALVAIARMADGLASGRR